MHPPIFHEFERKESVADGRSVYDFLGGAIDAAYKSGWGKHVAPEGAIVKPGYPAPSEWTIDWIACLLAAKLAGDRFSVIELGAGYGQWMVTAIMAYKTLHPNRPAHGMALEAEQTHYEWLQRNVQKNLGSYTDVYADLLCAAAGYDGVAQFPVLDAPDGDYGAAYRSEKDEKPMREVECLSMQTIDTRFDEKLIDLVHVDIQGAEADLIANPGLKDALGKTRIALFGTHRSNELHDRVKRAIESAGMQVLVEWPRNSFVETAIGDIKTNDGALLAVNPEVWNRSRRFISNNNLASK